MPNRTGASLNKEEIRRLAKSIKQVLKKAINFRGTTFNNYVDADGKKGDFVKMLKVYGRKNLPCLQCGAKIKKIKLAQRGTHFCARCQV
jgi:formamidopyrimidine-DNA glycosylase